MTEQTPELRDALCKALFMLDHAAVPLAFALLDERGDGIPEDIRGYGHVKARHLAAVKPKWARLLAQWRAGGVQAAA